MRKIITAGMAALTLGASLAATATPAAAESWHDGGSHQWRGDRGDHRDYDRRYYRGNNNSTGAAIAGGIVGLALGAALSSHNNGSYSNHTYYSRPYYGGSRYYYGNGYYEGGGYAVCTGRREIWDPYIGGYIVQRYNYAC